MFIAKLFINYLNHQFMKKNYFTRKTLRHVVILVAGMVLSLLTPVSAQVLLNENFDYPVGDLYGQGPWVKYGTVITNPVQVVDNALTYTGYQDAAIGKAVNLSNAKSSQKLVAKFTEGDDAIKEGALYFSALINVKQVDDAEKGNYFICFVQKVGATTNVGDGKSGTEFGKLLALKGSGENKFKLGVDRYSIKTVFTEEEYDINKTYLVILKYQFVEGSNNDEVSIFVNPTNFTTEPLTPNAIYKAESGSDVSRGLQGIELRQGATSSKAAPNVIIDALRVARSYAELFGGEAPPTPPTISLSKTSAYAGELLIGGTYEYKITVKGANLKGDIQLSGLTSGQVTASSTTVTKEQAESAEGHEITFTIKPTDPENGIETILFDSEGATQAKLDLAWYPVALTEINNLKALASEEPYLNTYKYTGKATISYIYTETDKYGSKNTTYYIQDATGALTIYVTNQALTTTYNVGDELTDFMCKVDEAFQGMPRILPIGETLGTVSSTGKAITPEVITLSELAAKKADYPARLIQIKNVTFKDIAAGATFTEDMMSPAINDGTADGRMKLFKGTDIIGTTIPTEAVTITGISTSTGAAIIAPRSVADITLPPSGPAAMEITPEKIERRTIDLNTTVEYAKLKVKTNNLSKKVDVYISGKNSSLFTSSVTEIPAGTHETDVVITYHPTEINVHEARITFDCTGEVDLSKAISFSAVCIDPANPPTITVNTDGLTDFSTEAGSTQEQTIKVTTANMPAYGAVKVMGEGEGSFRINTTMLLKNGDNSLKITFAPKKAGTFTERIQFSAIEVDTTYITVKGIATGGETPEKPEGDKLPLDTSNPLKLLKESFDNVTLNKPVAINGWKNVAMEGTRAWWGHEFKEEETVIEKAAKVTPYDSNVELGKEAPCEMLLVTPPLDYKNAESKIFTFRVMGQYLAEGQTDLLELCYIDMEDPEMYIAPVGGFVMPNVPDNNNEWLEYHINLENQEIADVFFMGFRFKSTRGRENSATYYIDDVSYGRTDLPAITPSLTQLAFEAEQNKDFTTEAITVETRNTTEAVTISVGGPNKSKFKASVNTLPAEGGSFTVSFNSDQIGVHEAYVKLSSRGAADVFIPISANNKEKGTGIAAIPFDEQPEITAYDIVGKTVMHMDACKRMEDITKALPAGTYILKVSSATGVQTVKVLIP